MSLYKRKDSPHYWIRFTPPGGPSVRVSSATTDRREAAKLEAKLRADCWQQSKLGVTARVRWEDACARFLREKQEGLGRPWKDAVPKMRNLHAHFTGVYLDQIDERLIQRYVTQRRAGGVGNTTINRDLQVVRAILIRAKRDWKVLSEIPVIRMLAQPNRRVRFLTRQEADRLIAQLPQNLQQLVVFSLATGLREGNVTGLEWSQVDLDRRVAWIHPDQHKNRRAHAVPLNADAMAVLRARQGLDMVRVFELRNGNCLQWQAALDRAGIQDFRWHDLRHTWASWHVQAGTPLSALQELGGWSSYEMVRRYAAFGADHLAGYAENVAGPRVVGGLQGRGVGR